MSEAITSSQLSILHVLRDGEDPMRLACPEQRIFVEIDLAQLAAWGLIERRGSVSALTLAGLDVLSEPGNSQPMSLDDMERYSRPSRH
ncbi:MAG: hypothetical protein H7276_11190 [Caulobacter sp.]|nr:hypothetical protein [Vitreoscilla sp.]